MVMGGGAVGKPAPNVDRASIETAVRTAYLPALLAALAQATGDISLLRDDQRPDPHHIQDPHGGVTRERRAAGRQLAADRIERLLAPDGPSDAGAPLTEREALRPLMSFVTGEAVSDDYARLLAEELGDPDDPRAPDWHRDDIDSDRAFRVAIIGGGMSGLLVSHRLRQAGIEHVILEKNADVGGTWLENRYPGCRVDVPNHLYSYSFRQRVDWPQRFSPRDVLLDYFRDCADQLGLRDDIRFGTTVVAARFRDAEADWELTIRNADGSEETLYAHAVISAVGQLNRPNLPDIAGRDSFAGPSFHSAQWNPDVDLRGKTVAVIGTAASAMQLTGAIADDVAELNVYQRTPNWFLPTPDYHAPVPEGMQWLLDHVPFYSQWYRVSLFWRLAEGMLPAAEVDPEWPEGTGSVSARNDGLRLLLTQYLEGQYAETPEMLPHVVPDYPPLAKRMLLDNGTWATTLQRPHVRLVTDPIERITPRGIVAGGVERRVDVIIYATGFQASSFLTPMQVTGRGGVDLHRQWGDDARAYLGISVPGFPNLFCMYGPNTNLVANGSIIFFSECEAHYILGCMRLLFEQGARTLDCRRDVHDDYNALIDDGNVRMAWGAAKVNSWYQNAAGRITQNWPFSLLEFWQRTRRPNPADYEIDAVSVV